MAAFFLLDAVVYEKGNELRTKSRTTTNLAALFLGYLPRGILEGMRLLCYRNTNGRFMNRPYMSPFNELNHRKIGWVFLRNLSSRQV